MKKLHSSTFLSIILAFFTYLGMQGQQIDIVKSEPIPVFSNISVPEVQIIDGLEVQPVIEKVNIDVFYTFGCRHCKSFGLYTIPVLLDKYLDKENIHLNIYLNTDFDDPEQYFPAIGLKCAEENDKYREMHNALFSTPEPLSQREVDLLGQGLEMPVVNFRSCLKSGKYDDFINSANNVAKEKGVTKMPVIFINDYVLTGNQPIENIQKIVNEILSK